MSETLEFFRTLYEHKPEDAYVNIWTLPDKKSLFQRKLEYAANYAVRRSEECDVYFGVGLSDVSYGEKARVKAAKVIGIPALWADFDLKGPAHKKTNLPETLEDIQALLQDAGPPPSLTVHSGHGIQSYWLFKEPWMFGSEAERTEAASLVQRWIGTLRHHAGKRGWDVDATHDLARVLRVPGTVNRKGEPVPVRLLSSEAHTYAPADFTPSLVVPVAPPRKKVASAAETPELVLKPDAAPPLAKLHALRENDPLFARSLNRTRKDFTDRSPSSYDFSLAGISARAGWKDQEIADLIIYARQVNGEDVQKALRLDYVLRTIHKVRQGIEYAEAVAELEELYEGVIPDGKSIDREQLRQKLQRSLLIDIRRVIKYTGEEPVYVMEMGDQVIKLGPVEGLIEQSPLRRHIANGAKQIIPTFKAHQWRNIAQALLDLVEDRETGPETTDRGLVEHWLEAYLTDQPPKPFDHDLVQRGAPYIRDGSIRINASALGDYLARKYGERPGHKELCKLLSRYGAMSVRENVPADGSWKRQTSKNVWALPAHFDFDTSSLVTD